MSIKDALLDNCLIPSIRRVSALSGKGHTFRGVTKLLTWQLCVGSLAVVAPAMARSDPGRHVCVCRRGPRVELTIWESIEHIDGHTMPSWVKSLKPNFAKVECHGGFVACGPLLFLPFVRFDETSSSSVLVRTPDFASSGLRTPPRPGSRLRPVRTPNSAWTNLFWSLFTIWRVLLFCYLCSTNEPN